MRYTEYLKTLSEGTDKIEDEIGKFWVVTKPTPVSLLIDIVFESDVLGFANQVRGGLDEKNEVYGIYKNKDKAETIGKRLLKDRK